MSDETAVLGAAFPRRLALRRDSRFRRRRRASAVWREHALAEIAAREFSLHRLEGVEPERRATIHKYLLRARAAANDSGLNRRERLWSTWRGASVERTWGLIDTAEESLLQVAPEDFVTGQLPRIRRRAERTLAADDIRRIEVDEIARRLREGASSGRELLVSTVAPRLRDAALSEPERAGLLAAITAPTPRYELTRREREALVTTFHAANCEARRRQTRVRSFRNMLLSCALVLTIAAAGLATVGALRPDLAPLCFQPGSQVVCPTKMTALNENAPATDQPAVAETAAQQAEKDELARDTATRIDLALVELMGLIGAALAGAATLRRMSGTSTPYAVPLALAAIKLPTGALTAALGLLLMRGEFVPGLTALDSPAQIIAWAIVFGYSQQLFTRFVDQRGQDVLDSAGNGAQSERSEPDPGAPAQRPSSDSL